MLKVQIRETGAEKNIMGRSNDFRKSGQAINQTLGDDDDDNEASHPPPAKKRRKRKDDFQNHALLDPFSILPNEVVIRILSHLEQEELTKNVAPVCKRFRDLALNPSLWTHLNLHFNYIEDNVSRLLDRCTMLRTLKLGNRAGSGRLAIKAMRNSPLLEEVGRFGSHVTLHTLADALTVCPSLRRLDLPAKDSYKILSDRASCLRNLTEITIDPRSNIYRDGFLEAIGRHCKRLTSFRHNRCSFRHCSFDEDDDAAFNSFLSGVRKSLKELEIDALWLTEVSLQTIGECQLLESVILHDAKRLGRKSLSSIVKLPNLRCLKVEAEHTLQNDVVIQAFESVGEGGGLRGLKSLALRIDELRDSGLMSIVNNCSGLKQVSLKNCRNITDAGIVWMLRKSTRLEELSLSLGLTHLVFKDCVAPLRTLEMPSGISEAEMTRIKSMIPTLRRITSGYLTKSY